MFYTPDRKVCYKGNVEWRLYRTISFVSSRSLHARDLQYFAIRADVQLRMFISLFLALLSAIKALPDSLAVSTWMECEELNPPGVRPSYLAVSTAVVVRRLD